MFTESSLWDSTRNYNDTELYLKNFYDTYHQYYPLEYFPPKNESQYNALQIATDFLHQHAVYSTPAELPEAQFFQNSLQIKIVRHHRYMYSVNHTHAFFEMIYVLQGECFNTVDGQSLPLEKGDICIIPPKVIHSIAVNSNSIVLNILLRTSSFTDAFSSLLKNTNILSEFFNEIVYSNTYKQYMLFRTGEDEQIQHQVLEMYTEQENKQPYFESILNGLLIAFLGRLLQLHETSVEYPDSYIERFSIVPKITSYIRQNCCDVTLNSCAETFHFNPQYLSSLLKKHTGKSFSSLLTDARMDRAAILLLESSISIQELGSLLGYSDASYFMKVFKKHFDHTPSSYRESKKIPPQDL